MLAGAVQRRRVTSTRSLAASVLLLAAVGGTGAAAQDVVATVPTYVDTVERGLRLRMDLGLRYNTVGLPDPPVRLEVDDIVNDEDDVDVSGLVIFGYDRPFGAPLVADFMGDFTGDIGGDSPVSPFLDQASFLPQARLYSAFVGLSGAPGEALEPYKANIGRMTELVESPITYDGMSLGGNWRFPKLGWFNAKLWGGIDAPQFMATDPFSRTDAKAYAERYVDDSGFVSPTGGVEIQQNDVDFNDDGIIDPILNPVGGLAVEGRFAGFGFVATHTLIGLADIDNQFVPTVQRTRTGASFAWEADILQFLVAADLKWTDFLPRNVGVKGDLLTGDGTTRVGLNTSIQFLQDVCAYDCTFRAFNTAAQFNQTLNDAGAAVTNDQIEQFRVKDQIRHLNIGPAQEHFALFADVERQFPFGVTGTLRTRIRQHFDAADLDYFRSDIYELGGGVAWSTGFALDMGTDVAIGTVNSGIQNGVAFDLLAEGITNYVENRTWVRTVLDEGKLSNLAEVFVRRHDIQTKGLLATGQWSAGFASTIRYDVLDFWGVSARLEADALSPVDTLNGSGYLGALVGTSVRF
jgi:hypothetical protein